MSIVVRLEKTLEDWWGTEEELASLDDDQLIELLHEDLLAVIEGATWTIIRGEQSGLRIVEGDAQG